MIADRKEALRKRYLAASKRLNKLLEPYDCGLSVARYISVDINEAAEVLEQVVAETKALMAEEGGRL